MRHYIFSNWARPIEQSEYLWGSLIPQAQKKRLRETKKQQAVKTKI